MRVLSATSRATVRIGVVTLAGAALLVGCAQASPGGSLAPKPATVSASAAGPAVSLTPEPSASAPETIPTASAVPTATLPTATNVPTPTALPTPSVVATRSAAPTRSPGPSGRAPSASARPTTKPSTKATARPGAKNPLAKLLNVPKGFTLPPGAKIQRAVTTGASSAVALSAPPAPVAVAYLRAELKRLGYTQLLVKKSGVITAYAYRSGSSIISLSGGQANGVSITAIVFAKVTATPKASA